MLGMAQRAVATTATDATRSAMTWAGMKPGLAIGVTTLAAAVGLGLSWTGGNVAGLAGLWPAFVFLLLATLGLGVASALHLRR